MEISEFKTIKYEKDKEGGFALITLNRPDALNAQNVQMKKELQWAFHEVLKDDDVKVYIFTGAPRSDGKPCFCAGMDLKEMAQGIDYTWPELKGELYAEQDGMFGRGTIAAELWARRPVMPRNPTWWYHVWCPKISIAAVDGVATAGGIELAVVCDILLASETAKFSDLHVKNLGIGIGGGEDICMTLAKKAGVDIEKVRDALLGGFAQSRILDLHGKRILEDNFQPGFKIKLHRKDMNIALQTGRTLSVPLPGTAQVASQMDAIIAQGNGDLDHSALALFLQELSNVRKE